MQTVLGDDYQKYFTVNSCRAMGPFELIHYSETLWDKQITNLESYRANKESHVYCLLRCFLLASEDEGVGFNL